MKSENPSSQAVARFWEWFSTMAPKFDQDVGNDDVIADLDNRIRHLNKALSWEIGPGLRKEWQLVISPNLDQALWPTARRIVAEAPPLAKWEFYSARQPKEWDYEIILDATSKHQVRLNAASWHFVLLRYPDGETEVLLEAKDLPSLSDDLRWSAAAIALESILGEEVVLSTGMSFDLVERLDPDMASRARPIHELAAAVRGSIA